MKASLCSLSYIPIPVTTPRPSPNPLPGSIIEQHLYSGHPAASWTKGLWPQGGWPQSRALNPGDNSRASAPSTSSMPAIISLTDGELGKGRIPPPLPTLRLQQGLPQEQGWEPDAPGFEAWCSHFPAG